MDPEAMPFLIFCGPSFPALPSVALAYDQQVSFLI
jgi:hypothetical protein